MQNLQPKKERGVPFQVLLKPSDVEFAKLGGAKTMAAACREGLAPYIEEGKKRAGVIKPPHERMNL